MIIIGIDPGVEGAIAFIDDGYLQIYDMPMLGEGKGAEIDHVGLKNILDPDDSVCIAYIEQQIPMPKQNSISTASCFKNYGILLGVIRTMGISSSYVTPNTWKKAMGVLMPRGFKGTQHARKKASKAIALRKASQLFPLHDFGKKDGQAEAALIAEYGRRLNGAQKTKEE